jgi:hypothetical protein
MNTVINFWVDGLQSRSRLFGAEENIVACAEGTNYEGNKYPLLHNDR